MYYVFTYFSMRHVKFIARTVFVQNNNVEEAARVLNRILGKEEIFDQFRRTRYYEKPFQVSSDKVMFQAAYIFKYFLSKL